MTRKLGRTQISYQALEQILMRLATVPTDAEITTIENEPQTQSLVVYYKSDDGTSTPEGGFIRTTSLDSTSDKIQALTDWR